MLSKVFDFLKENAGKTVAYVVVFSVLAFGGGITVNNYITGLETNVQLNTLYITQLEKNILQEEQYNLEGLVFEKEQADEVVNPRIENRLEKVIKRIDLLEAREKELLEGLKDE